MATGNPFRSTDRELTAKEAAAVAALKEKAEALWYDMDASLLANADPRMVAVAKTNLEVAVMWAVKAITN